MNNCIALVKTVEKHLVLYIALVAGCLREARNVAPLGIGKTRVEPFQLLVLLNFL